MNHTAGRAEQESEIKQVVLQEEAACGEETQGKRLHHLLDHGQALTQREPGTGGTMRTLSMRPEPHFCCLMSTVSERSPLASC